MRCEYIWLVEFVLIAGALVPFISFNFTMNEVEIAALDIKFETSDAKYHVRQVNRERQCLYDVRSIVCRKGRMVLL